MLTEVASNQVISLPMWRGSQADHPLRGLTVLLVEDSRFASEAIRLLCLKSGARIRRADCLESARRHLRSWRPSVLIVDLGLPDGDGADLIRQVASSRPRVPVILGTSGTPEAEQAALDAGADGFLPKPIESLGVFQHQILSCLTEGDASFMPEFIPDETLRPDVATLREDLIAASDWLSQPRDLAEIDYIARFLAGIARSGDDCGLEQVATLTAREMRDGGLKDSRLLHLRGVLRQRLARVADA
jgi:DNA-binding NarL/FixJ family response regulator